MHRGTFRARGERLLQEDQAEVLSVRRVGRRHLGLYGSAGAQASSSGIRMGEGAAFASFRLEAHPGVQLPAGDGGGNRLGARLITQPPRSAQRFASYW